MTGSTDIHKVEWIKAKEALLLLSADGRSPVEVKSMLAEYLRDGQLTAHAEAIWTSTEPKLGLAWKDLETSDDLKENLVVPVRYWRSDESLLDDRARWRWPFNKFFYTITSKPLKRRMFKGVSFSISELRALQPHLGLPTPKARRGRKPNIAGRDAGWMEVVRISQEGSLDSSAYQSQAELEKHLLERLSEVKGESRLGENQVREIARMVFGALKPPR